jgi:hypothetical protein
LVVTNCSDAFTQDVEDFGHEEGERIEGKPAGSKEAQEKVRDEKMAGPAVIGFDALAWFKEMKKALGEPLYRYALRKWGFEKSNQITTDKLAAVQKQMGKAKMALDSMTNGEWPRGVTQEVFFAIPEAVQSSYQQQAKRELQSLLGEDLGLEAFEDARKAHDNRFSMCEALAKEIESLRAQQGVS